MNIAYSNCMFTKHFMKKYILPFCLLFAGFIFYTHKLLMMHLEMHGLYHRAQHAALPLAEQWAPSVVISAHQTPTPQALVYLKQRK